MPWKDLDLTAITGQTVENRHLFDVHLGETIAPYVALEPLKVLLPLKREDVAIPTDDDGPGGIRLGGLERRMRERWQTVSRLWEENRAAANKMNLLAQLDYYGKLSSQLEWQKDAGDRPVRLVYTSSGQPTAALIQGNDSLVDYTLFWMACSDIQEANYLLAIINSQALYEAVASLMPKGQFGARHLEKHLWTLPIPEFDPDEPLHSAVSEAGRVAAEGAAERLAQLRQDRGEVTVTIARHELRKWLRESTEGKAAEEAVEKLLGTGQVPTNPPSGGH